MILKSPLGATQIRRLRLPLLRSKTRKLTGTERRMNALNLHKFDLMETFAKPGCPVCLLLKRCDVRTLDSLLYESVNDVFVRERIRRSLGFCNYHSGVLEKIPKTTSPDLLSVGGAALGIAIIYLDLVETLAEQLKSSPIVSSIRRSLTDSKAICPLCVGREELETAYLRTVLLNIHDPDFREKYSASDGLCARHMQKAFRLRELSHDKEELASIEGAHLGLLAKDLREFVRKHDYRFSSEGFGKEADSWRRALRKISGELSAMY